MSEITITELKESKNIYNPGKVLIIEDDLIMCRVLTTLLDILGIKADAVHCAKDALLEIDNSYKLIFIDIGLPDMTGWHLARVIRNLKSPLCDMPIFAMSAHASYEDIKNNSEFITDFIQKPITLKLIQEKIKLHVPMLLEQN